MEERHLLSIKLISVKGSQMTRLRMVPLFKNGNTYKYWEVTKDVIYNSGKISIDVNGGKVGERYILKQGDKIIFDTDLGNEWR